MLDCFFCLRYYQYQTACFFVVQKSIELITKAKKPVVLVGSQATLPPVPVEQLRKALEVGTCTRFTGGRGW